MFAALLAFLALVLIFLVPLILLNLLLGLVLLEQLQDVEVFLMKINLFLGQALRYDCCLLLDRF